jgi:hypothetical protein
MNQNPWQVESLARYERDRIREEMRQIRMQERALKARVRKPNFKFQVWRILLRWLVTGSSGPKQTGAPSTLRAAPRKTTFKI